MIEKLKDRFGPGFQRRGLSYWKAAAQTAQSAKLGELKSMRLSARVLRNHLDQIEHVATGRLMHPRLGSNAMRTPELTDWAYRPELWRGIVSPAGAAGAKTQTQIGTATTLFHDCETSEITIRQVRNTSDGDLSPFGLHLDVLGFRGSFLSVVLDFPPDAVEGLRLDHIVRLDVVLRSERPVEVYARLNIKFGPNIEQITRQLPLHLDEVFVEFDLEQSDINEKALDQMWLDLIFENVEMNAINLRDVVLTRRPRAAF